VSDKRKIEKVGAMPTEALTNILGSLSAQEARREPSADYPLGGLVHIGGIGAVPVKQLRAELERRGVNA
jgi:hypothetical protein